MVRSAHAGAYRGSAGPNDNQRARRAHRAGSQSAHTQPTLIKLFLVRNHKLCDCVIDGSNNFSSSASIGRKVLSRMLFVWVLAITVAAMDDSVASSASSTSHAPSLLVHLDKIGMVSRTSIRQRRSMTTHHHQRSPRVGHLHAMFC